MLDAFFNAEQDSYAILQLKLNENRRDVAFMPMRYLRAVGKEPDPNNYELVYVGELKDYSQKLNVLLEQLFAKFNMNRPDDFHGHSLSVSDVVGVKMNGEVSFHFVDSIGFEPLPGFSIERGKEVPEA